MKNLLFALAMLSAPLFQAQNMVLTSFATGFTSPVEIVNAKDSRLFVVQQNGIIKILRQDGSVNSANFLNISTKILFGGERGLLGLAFHPDYATNGFFYVFYNNTAGNITVARYTVSSNPDVANASTEKILLSIPKPFDNHNGGSMHFAPDGYLWISTGDGGSGGDPNNNAQNKNSLLGKMLRIDVNSAGTYNIPAGNPFVGTDGADEIWSYGMRNAWKFSFDLTAGNVMLADVGQGVYEEINRMPITQAGINYGWRCYEGNTAYNTTGCAAVSTMTFPVAVYDHAGGKCSITGGYVYRGSLYPALFGKYIFADYCSRQIGVMSPEGSISWSTAFAGNNFATFGEDFNKELYVAAINNGTIYKVSTTTLAADANDKNSFKIVPNPASDRILVQGPTSDDYSVEILNAEGRLVLNTKNKPDGSVDVSALSAGIYFVTIKYNSVKAYTQKLIIK